MRFFVSSKSVWKTWLFDFKVVWFVSQFWDLRHGQVPFRWVSLISRAAAVYLVLINLLVPFLWNIFHLIVRANLAANAMAKNVNLRKMLLVALTLLKHVFKVDLSVARSRLGRQDSRLEATQVATESSSRKSSLGRDLSPRSPLVVSKSRPKTLGRFKSWVSRGLFFLFLGFFVVSNLFPG